jgi:transposase InsO family protein
MDQSEVLRLHYNDQSSGIHQGDHVPFGISNNIITYNGT